MIEKEIKIINKLGMHARAAAKFVHCASRFRSRIHVSKDGQQVDGKSILGLLMLAACKNSSVTLTVDGSDEKEACRELEILITGKFGEEE